MKTEENVTLNPSQISIEVLQSELEKCKQENAALKEQLAWFTRQIFGKKSGAPRKAPAS